MSDLPRDELMRAAEQALAATPGAWVQFKYTCAHCGERRMLAERNVLYERGWCHVCGRETVIDRGGFALMLVTGDA